MRNLIDILLVNAFGGSHSDILSDFSHLTQCEIRSLLLELRPEELISQARKLGIEERVSLVKALAKLEVSIGGLGSVTLVKKLLDSFCMDDRSLLGWVLANYPNFYYGKGACSIEEYEEQIRLQAVKREKAKSEEMNRQAKARSRIADDASQKLFNAVRRGDLNAVAALLQRGGDPRQLTPSGQSLVSYALREGKDDVAELLKTHIQ